MISSKKEKKKTWKEIFLELITVCDLALITGKLRPHSVQTNVQLITLNKHLESVLLRAEKGAAKRKAHRPSVYYLRTNDGRCVPTSSHCTEHWEYVALPSCACDIISIRCSSWDRGWNRVLFRPTTGGTRKQHF